VVAGAQKLSSPVVLLFSGPPATGKSTLADAIGRELPAPLIAWDWLVAGLTQFAEVPRVLDTVERDTYRDVGYALMAQMVEKHKIVLDAVDPLGANLERVRAYVGLGKDGHDHGEEP
jgi:DNA polymerase III delta prime subunit